MTSATTTERVPNGQLFDIEMKSPWTRLNGDPTWHAIAIGIDGYADLQHRLAALRAWKDSAGHGLEAAIGQAVDAAAATGDVDTAFEPVAEILRRQESIGTARTIHHRAIRTVQAEAERWVRSDDVQEAFARTMTERISAIVEEARQLALVVAGARSFDEIGADAPRAAAFAQTTVLAEQLRVCLATSAAVVQPFQTTGTMWAERADRWPLAYAIPAYEKAWPDYWRRDPITVTVSGARPNQFLPASRPWFDAEASALDVLTGAVERDLRIEVGSRKRVEARSKALDDAADKRRTRESETLAHAEWTNAGSESTW